MNDERNDKPLTTATIARADVAPPRNESPARREAGRPGVETAPHEADGRTPLLPQQALDDLHRRWTDIQSRFVDEPRRAVEQADGLVAELMKRLAETFAGERAGLESQWGSNKEVDTEELRLALQRYRSFFNRLLDI